MSSNLVPSPNLNDVTCWRGKSKNRSWRDLRSSLSIWPPFLTAACQRLWDWPQWLTEDTWLREVALAALLRCNLAWFTRQIPHVVRLWDGLPLVCQDHEVAGPRDSTVSPASLSIPTPNFLARYVFLVQECHALTCRRLPLSCVPSAASSLYHLGKSTIF